MPLVDGKSCCQGRRKTAVSRAGDNVVAFFVRWTRSDFRGCIWYTHNGSEGVLWRSRWTWYRPSKWTWSTAVPKARGGSVPPVARITSCRGRRGGIAPLVARKSSCRGRRGGLAPLVEGNRVVWGAGAGRACRNKKATRVTLMANYLTLSGKRGSDPRPQPWQGCALPTELFPQCCHF